MEDETDSSANIEWKQDKKPSKNSRLSRRIDIKKLALEDKKNDKLDVGVNRIKNTAPNLKKIRSKIKEVFDEDEEEDSQTVFFDFNHENNESSLLNALKEEEKQKIQVSQTIKNQNMQQTAGKMEAIAEVSRKLRQTGLKNIDNQTINNNMISVLTDEKTFDNALKQHLTKKEKINLSKISSLEETRDLMNGIRKIKQAQMTNQTFLETKDIRNFDPEELQSLGREKDEKAVAEKIIDMTGRKKAKEKDIPKQDKQVMRRKIAETMRQQDKLHKERE